MELLQTLRDFINLIKKESFFLTTKVDGIPLGEANNMKMKSTLQELSQYATGTVPEAGGAYRRELSRVITGGPCIYTFDIETSLNTVGAFSAKTNFINSKNVFKPWYMLSWAARELGTDVMEADCLPAHARFSVDPKDDTCVCESLAAIFNKADILVGHNIKRFDVPKFMGRCAFNGIPQPRMPKLVDTLQIAKNVFSFMHNNLDGLCEILFRENKAKHGGIDMWMRIEDLTATKEDWESMMKYNCADVDLTEKLYLFIRGFSKASHHPCWTSFGEAGEDEEYFGCKICGSKDLTRGTKTSKTHSGLTATNTWVCQNCGQHLKEGGVGSNLVTPKKRRNTLRTAN